MAPDQTQPTSPGSRPSVLCAPIRLLTGWGANPRRLGTLAALMLILLRITIGWHFYSEGTSKLHEDFDSSRFLGASRGPFAEHFQAVIWDRDGKLRLNKKQTLGRWKWFAAAAAQHYDFNKNQRVDASKALEVANQQYSYILSTHAGDLHEIELGRDRIEKLSGLPERSDVTSLNEQRQSIEQEWHGLLDPILKQIDACWDNLENDINKIATDEQQARGRFSLPPLRDQRIDTTVMDQVIPWFDITIGVLLLLGLFTPLAALVAAAFLFSVFLSQYPPASGPMSTYYQLIESMACLVVASTGAGRFAGLDSIIHAAIHKRSANQKG